MSFITSWLRAHRAAELAPASVDGGWRRLLAGSIPEDRPRRQA